MNGILLLGGGMVMPPIEQLVVWILFYSTLFWLPVRGLAALVDHCRGHGDADCEQVVRVPAVGEPGYCIGMHILPPM